MDGTSNNSALGKDIFAELYRADLEREAEVMRYGAVEKANSIQFLLQEAGMKPDTLLELGCGTGAVLGECQRRGLGKEYFGVDYSQEAIEYLRAHVTGVQTAVVDLMVDDLPFEGPFDVVVLSHVLEHMEEPGVFLASALHNLKFQFLVAEVPLEDLPVLRLRKRLFGNPSVGVGHIQSYRKATFEQMLRTSGLTVVGRRTYLPIPSREMLRLIREKDGESTRTYYRRLLGRWLKVIFRPLWMRLYYAHYACLCVPRT